MDNELITRTVDEIVSICSPLNIILISSKVSTDGSLAGFKLVVIVNDNPEESISDLECRLYMQIDSEIPFDLVLYSRSEWEKFKNDTGTFAWKTHNTGVYIYGENL
ncbi:MAG: hypothetical protein MJ095_02480 [Oscillospiraceae bacterium]|nr:hypothetical protein [Oscillospiraceae bacterium]